MAPQREHGEEMEPSVSLPTEKPTSPALVADAGPQGSIETLPRYVAAEMKEVGLYDLFAGAEARHAAGEVALEHANSSGVA